MDFIISLAHFCEVHGPTSILSTQVLPISCLTCFPPGPSRPCTPSGHLHDLSETPQALRPATTPTPTSQDARQRPCSSEPHSRNPSFSRRIHDGTPATQKSALNQQLSSFNFSTDTFNPSPGPSTPFQSPPGSPQSAGPRDGQYWGSLGSQGSHGLDSIKTATDACPNCSLSVPKSLSEQLPDGAPGSPIKDGKGRHGSPVLRTREAFMSSGIGQGWSSEEDLHDDDSGSSQRSKHEGRLSSTLTTKGIHHLSRPTSSSSSVHTPSRSRASTFTNTTRPSTPSSPHPHTLTYLTTRQPPSLSAHALLRRSCIRTLSCEQLPRPNKGPLFFGDDDAGYTISYAFRLQDPNARGRSRRYAFICWAGRDERRAARAWKEVIGVFEGMAGWVEALVERNTNRDVIDGGLSSSDGAGSRARDLTPLSSFLSGRAVDPDGFPRHANVRTKGLAELTGKDDFFVEVHAVFVRLLTRLGRSVGGLSSAQGAVVDSGIRGEVGEVGVRLAKRMEQVRLLSRSEEDEEGEREEEEAEEESENERRLEMEMKMKMKGDEEDEEEQEKVRVSRDREDEERARAGAGAGFASSAEHAAGPSLALNVRAASPALSLETATRRQIAV